MNEIPDILHRIVSRRRQRVAEQRNLEIERVVGAASMGEGSGGDSDLLGRIRAWEGAAIIAEVKLGSPRLGSLEEVVDPERQARLYARGGAAALSVVVEPDFFYGSYELLARCSRASGLPTLAKDFVIDAVQLEWAAAAGAAAVLLIAALHSQQDLAKLGARARQLGLVPLVECHEPSDVEKLAGGSWELVGVNHRNLRTFEVDLRHSTRMLQRLPSGACKVAESGIGTRAEIEFLAAAGFDAFLVGETLLTAEDPARKLQELVGHGPPR